MARKKMDGPRRQLFANIDEELYLKLKEVFLVVMRGDTLTIQFQQM